MIDIASIGLGEVKYNNRNLLTLKEYRKIAKRIIVGFSYYGPHFVNQMLRSEDVISNATTQVMIADWQWNGGGTLYGYRKQRVVWAIKSMINRNKKYISLGELDVEDKRVSYTASIEQKELVSKIFNAGILSSRQEECLKLKFYNDMTMKDISKKLNITKQMVDKHIRKAKRNIRELIGEIN